MKKLVSSHSDDNLELLGCRSSSEFIRDKHSNLQSSIIFLLCLSHIAFSISVFSCDLCTEPRQLDLMSHILSPGVLRHDLDPSCELLAFDLNQFGEFNRQIVMI